jgi:hypothetical protein
VTSAITGAVVSVEVVLSVLFEPSSLLHEMTERLKQEIRKMNKNFFIFTSIPKVKYYWLCIRRTQYIPRFGGVLQVCGDFTWRMSDSVKN